MEEENMDIYKEHFREDHQTLVLLGEKLEYKQIEFFLQAIGCLSSQSVWFNLILIGEVENKNRLIGLAQELGIGELVWFYGSCVDKQILATLLLNADLFVLPEECVEVKDYKQLSQYILQRFVCNPDGIKFHWHYRTMVDAYFNVNLQSNPIQWK